MSFNILSFSLDVLILLALGATIFYVLRLSKSLQTFRSYRSEFTALVEQLSQNIAKAQETIESMRLSGQISSQELQGRIEEAQALLDELKIVNDASSGLASRLEGLAEKNRAIAESLSYGALPDKMESVSNESSVLKNGRSNFEAEGVSGFRINDREFESELGGDDYPEEGTFADPALEDDDGGWGLEDENESGQQDDDISVSEGISKAEQELMQALKRSGKM